MGDMKTEREGRNAPQSFLQLYVFYFSCSSHEDEDEELDDASNVQCS